MDDAPPMSASRKTTFSKKKWQATRRRYTWHLRPPFNTEFDRSHWWRGSGKVEPEAALYELARRHSLASEIPPEQIQLPGTSPLVALPSFLQPKPSLRLTQRFGMKSWQKLTASERREWKSNIGMMKGFDSRPIESHSIDITRQADLKIIQQRNTKMTLTGNATGYSGFLGSLASFARPTDQEWEAAISDCAVEAHRQGYVLIAVAHNLAAGKAGTALVKQYRKHSRLYPQRKQRERWEDWLLLIEEFENDEGAGRSQVTSFCSLSARD